MGDQSIVPLPPPKCAILRSGPPSAGAMRVRRSLASLRTYAIRVPSGDQQGAADAFPGGLMRSGGAPPTSFTYTPGAPGGSHAQTNANCLLSGESAGWYSMPEKVVSGITS